MADVVTLESLALRNTRLLHEIGSMHEERADPHVEMKIHKSITAAVVIAAVLLFRMM